MKKRTTPLLILDLGIFDFGLENHKMIFEEEFE